MKIACIDISNDFYQALCSYNNYLSLDLDIVRLDPKQSIEYTLDDEVILLAHNHTPEELKLLGKLQTIRGQDNLVAIPMILVSEPMAPEAQTLFDEIELVWKASVPFDSGKFFALLEDVTKFRAENQKLLETRRSLKQAVTKKKHKTSMELLKAMEDKWPTPLHFMVIKAEILIAVEKYAESEKYLKKILDEQPKSFSAYALLGRVYYHLNKIDLMKAAIDQSSALAEIHVKNLIHWGNIYLERGEGKKSMTAFEKALEKEEENLEAKEGLLAASLMTGTMELTKKVLEHSPNAFDLARLCNLKGIAMAKAGHYQSAEKLYRNAIQFLPDNHSEHKLWFNLGLCLKKAGALKKALQYFEKSQASAPKGFERVVPQINKVKKELAERERVFKP